MPSLDFVDFTNKVVECTKLSKVEVEEFLDGKYPDKILSAALTQWSKGDYTAMREALTPLLKPQSDKKEEKATAT